MAAYKHDRFLEKTAHAAFDKPVACGGIAVFGGIYRCTHCGQEVVCAIGTTLPGTCPRRHGAGDQAHAWQLVIAAN